MELLSWSYGPAVVSIPLRHDADQGDRVARFTLA